MKRAYRNGLSRSTKDTHRFYRARGWSSMASCYAARAPRATASADLCCIGVRSVALFAVTLILPEGDVGWRGQVDRRRCKVGSLNRLQVVMEVGGWQAQLAYGREGLGVAMVPSS